MIPAHGHAAVEAVFMPTSAALKLLGTDPFGYALGYISIDGQVGIFIQDFFVGGRGGGVELLLTPFLMRWLVYLSKTCALSTWQDGSSKLL